MSTITIHSFKGGTGKSLIAVLLAYQFSVDGEKVLLIDGDYNAPCLHSYFPKEGNAKSFTSYLKGDCKLKDAMAETRFPGLFMSYAPSPSFRLEMARADVKTHGRYLKKMLEGIDVAHEKLGFDRVIFDNSSGISLPAINQLTCSNKSVLVIRPVRYGVESTYEQIDAIYKKLRYADSRSVREDFIVWNQVPILENQEYDPRIAAYLEYWIKKFGDAGIRHCATIPYLSQVVSAMISNKTLDVPMLAESMKSYVMEMKQKLT